MFDSAQAEWKEDVLILAAERFERTLAGQMAGFRVDVTRDVSALREEVTRHISGLREDMTREISAFRVDAAKQVSEVRQEVATTRVELLKWSFLFWVGQVAAMAGLLAFMLQSVP